jgi:bis(5'-nucleosyl)-tetraphosphatase (symmetrical)
VRATSRERERLRGRAVEIPIPSCLDSRITLTSTRRMAHESHRTGRKRVLIVGDVHGCMAELRALLAGLTYKQDEDVLIFVGDLVGKGPHSGEVVRFARENGCLAVLGNWDAGAVRHYSKSRKREGNGLKPKWTFVEQLTEADINWLRSRPFTIELPDHNCLVVHAGLVPGKPLADQAPTDMLEMRSLLPLAGGGYTTSDNARVGLAWAELWQGPPHIYFGHDAGRGLQRTKHATGLDTGCYKGGALTACILPGRRLYSVRAGGTETTCVPGRENEDCFKICGVQ